MTCIGWFGGEGDAVKLVALKARNYPNRATTFIAMRINSYKLWLSTVYCRRPFKIASGTQDACTTLILEVATTSGYRGLGEAVPIPLLTDETLDGCRQTLVEQLLPCLRGRHIWELADIHREMAGLTRAKSARCAIDLALHYAQAQSLGLPLSGRLGTSLVKFPTNYSIGIEDVQVTLELAREIVSRGFDRIKLKVGREPQVDIEVVRKVSERLPLGVKLRLDANGGWDRLGAVQALKAMARAQCPIELVEQPVAREDFHGLRFVRHQSEFPIAADESVQTIEDAIGLLDDDCVDILNLKLMKSGGIFPTLAIASLAKARGCRLMIGGMVGESLLGVQAAAAVAAACRFDYADLDADILLKSSPFEAHDPEGEPLECQPPFRSWGVDLYPRSLNLMPHAVLVDSWQD